VTFLHDPRGLSATPGSGSANGPRLSYTQKLPKFATVMQAKTIHAVRAECGVAAFKTSAMF
jgi:hypothetical protein